MDLIKRQDAIDAFNTGVDELIVEGKGNAEAVEKYLNGVIGRIKDLPSAQPEPLTNIQDILEYLDTVLHPIISPEHWDVYSELHDMISVLPSAQSDITHCQNCKFYQSNHHWCKLLESEFSLTDFCSYAERIEVTE